MQIDWTHFTPWASLAGLGALRDRTYCIAVIGPRCIEKIAGPHP